MCSAIERRPVRTIPTLVTPGIHGSPGSGSVRIRTEDQGAGRGAGALMDARSDGEDSREQDRRGESAAECFARCLRELHQAAGSPARAELIRRGLAHKPPVRLTPASLSDWLAGRSTPTAHSTQLAFLLGHLETTANRLNPGRQATPPEQWRELRSRAEKERRARQRSRSTTGSRPGQDARGVDKSGPEPGAPTDHRPVGARYGGGHIDFSRGTFTGPVTGKVEHHHGPAPTALASLAPVPAGFVGRVGELARLVATLAPARETPGPTATAHECVNTATAPGPQDGDAGTPVVVCAAVAGMGGVGKTALALAAAHALLDRGRFQHAMFVNLRGYDPDPVTGDQALEALLRALGVDPVHIPRSPDERAGLYRSALDTLDRDGQAVLILADNIRRRHHRPHPRPRPVHRPRRPAPSGIGMVQPGSGIGGGRAHRRGDHGHGRGPRGVPRDGRPPRSRADRRGTRRVVDPRRGHGTGPRGARRRGGRVHRGRGGRGRAAGPGRGRVTRTSVLPDGVA